MKIFNTSVSRTSLLLLAIQLVLVCSVAATYVYERAHYPRVWTRTVAFDPSLPLRGRYLSLRLMVDACQSSLPSGKLAVFPRDFAGAIKPGPWTVAPGQPFSFPVELRSVNNKLVAIRPQEGQETTTGKMITAWPGTTCDKMILEEPVDFYIAEHAALPLPLQTGQRQSGQELWIEVTLPPKGPPRPIALALMQNGTWHPLAYQ